MKSVIALFITLLATASAFAPVQQTVGAYLMQSIFWNTLAVVGVVWPVVLSGTETDVERFFRNQDPHSFEYNSICG